MMGTSYPNQEIPKAFGVYNEERATDQRVTFIIDTEGIIRHVIEDAQDMDRHPREALEIIKSWSSV
jgi:alkyl hydroperoxide reductase subunit AhpC